ncbi:ABC transporter permease [Candidatus Riesia sp. GBBU]|nr:ABC transporter permease [Candidatus Riesia sp. GBBU]
MKFYWIAIKTIWLKEVQRFTKIWIQTLLPSVVTVSLYFIIFGKLIGERIGNMDGISYINFIVPGLIMNSVITNSYINVCSSFFGAKFQRSIEELLISPIPTYVIVVGYIGGGVFRGISVAILVTSVSRIFVNFQIYSFTIVTSIILMTSILFSLAGLTNAIFAKTFDDISIIPTFILTPLTYFGGVFYSLSLLPKNWQFISKFNPIVYMIDGLRYGFLGIGEISLYRTISILVIFTVLLYLLNWILIKKIQKLRI